MKLELKKGDSLCIKGSAHTPIYNPHILPLLLASPLGNNAVYLVFVFSTAFSGELLMFSRLSVGSHLGYYLKLMEEKELNVGTST